MTSLATYGQSNQSTMQNSLTNKSYDTLALDSIKLHTSFSYLYSAHDPIVIFNDESFTSANGVVSGNGTEVDPYVIEGWNIISSGVHGIYICGTSKYFLIRNNFIDTGKEDYIHGIFIDNVISGTAKIENNFCQNNWFGIYLYSSDNNSFNNNSCSSNGDYGIYLDSSDNNNLTNNNCNSNGDYGIYLFNSDNNNLTNNSCSNDYYGIHLYNSHFNSLISNSCSSNEDIGIFLSSSSNNNLTDNTCSSNEDIGIYLSSSSNYNSLINNTCNSNYWYGIHLSFSSYYNSLMNNTCNSNYCNGINFFNSDFNLLSWNHLFDNEYGVYLDSDSDNNIIHHNTFINNSYSPQASDDGSNNQWFDTETNEGNYWSDYSGSGNYQIAGTASSIDLYPLSEPIIIAEFTILKGYFLVLFTSFILLCHIRRKNIKSN